MMKVLNFLRAPLPRDVPPGGTVEVEATVEVPAEPGRYIVELDLVAEEIAWFGQQESPTVQIAFEAFST